MLTQRYYCIVMMGVATWLRKMIWILDLLKHVLIMETVRNAEITKANKAANKIFEVVTELKDQDNLQYLVKFLQHDNDSVGLWGASYLLNVQEEIALNVPHTLIGKPKSLLSLSAEVTLSEWKKGTLIMYFK